MSGKIILFTLKFFIFSILLFLLFNYKVVAQFYVDVLVGIVRHVLPASLADQPVGVQARIFNNVLFAALLLATPNIPFIKRMKLLLIGFAAIFIFHVPLAIFGCNVVFLRFSLFFRAIVEALHIISQIVFPLGLWIVLTYKYVVKDFKPEKAEVSGQNDPHTCPICGKKKKRLSQHMKTVHGHRK